MKRQASQIRMTATKRRLRRDADKSRGDVRRLSTETLEFLAPLRQDVVNELQRRAVDCDHDWVDDSHAGPDSGNIDMTCRKCGKTCYTNLY